MKYHPNQPLATKPIKKFTQKELDKLKKEKQEVLSTSYRISRKLGKRDIKHAEHYRNYLDAKSDLADIRKYERTGEWYGNIPTNPSKEIYYRVVAEAYNDDGSLKGAPKGALVDSFGRIVNDSDVKK